nr:hypothetical protein KPHV_01380 [Kitasatospora purpeofusca]
MWVDGVEVLLYQGTDTHSAGTGAAGTSDFMSQEHEVGAASHFLTAYARAKSLGEGAVFQPKAHRWDATALHAAAPIG